jgi:DNA polymerase-1
VKKVLIIEGQGVAWASYYMTNLSTRAGVGTGAIFGTLRSIKHLLDRFRPDILFLCFDKTKSGRRRRLYPEYKKHREEKMTEEDKLNRAEFNRQMPELYEGLYALGVPVVIGDGVESDDCVAVLTHAYSSDHQVIIASNDKDFLQLINDNVSVYSTSKDMVIKPDNFKECTAKMEKIEVGVELESWRLYRSIVGDSSDNIPGIVGCGAKTGRTLTDGITTIEELVDSVKSSDKSVCQKIVAQQDTIRLFWDIMDLQDIMSEMETVNAVYNAVDSIEAQFDKTAFILLCKRWEFFSIIAELNSWLRPFEYVYKSETINE